MSSVWMLRTWADVRAGDVVRMPGRPETASSVEGAPIRLEWHVRDGARESWREGADGRREAYWAPEDRVDWTTGLRVTLQPLNGGPAHRPANGMDPAAAVEILMKSGELAAMHALYPYSADEAFAARTGTHLG